MVMPGKNGPEVVNEVAPLHPNAKVLFISGYAPQNEAEAGDSRVLRKPFTGGALARRVREVLDAGQQPSDEAAVSARMGGRGKSSTRRKSC
jgi:DNA-binding NtrC family response regulator